MKKNPHPLNNLLGLTPRTLENFINKIDQNGPGGCWIWTASAFPTGYGQFRCDELGRTPRYAHRLCYELSAGEIGKGKHIHHVCEVRKCVNPKHLEPVTPQEHLVDKTPGSVAAIQARKTHCKNGHEFTPENTLTPIEGNGQRHCRACKLAYMKKRHAKFRAENPLEPKSTHCPAGHEFTPENTFISRTGPYPNRVCRACRRERSRTAYYKSKAQPVI